MKTTQNNQQRMATKLRRSSCRCRLCSSLIRSEIDVFDRCSEPFSNEEAVTQRGREGGGNRTLDHEALATLSMSPGRILDDRWTSNRSFRSDPCYKASKSSFTHSRPLRFVFVNFWLLAGIELLEAKKKGLGLLGVPSHRSTAFGSGLSVTLSISNRRVGPRFYSCSEPAAGTAGGLSTITMDRGRTSPRERENSRLCCVARDARPPSKNAFTRRNRTDHRSSS